MRISRPLLIAALLLLASCQTDTGEDVLSPAARYGSWEIIFNGENLEGWTPKFSGSPLGENYKNTFRVEDGKLVVSYDEYDSFNGEFGHLFYKDKLSHYKLRLEYRFVGEQAPDGPDWAIRNNGVMLHSQAPATMRIEQSFPVCVETQFLGGLGEGERSTGNMCSPGSHVVIDGELKKEHCIYSSSPTYHGEQWVTAELEVRGNDLVKHIINGEEVFRLTNPEFDADDPDGKNFITADNKLMHEGYIALQAETHPTEFRNIELMLLDPNELDPKK